MVSADREINNGRSYLFGWGDIFVLSLLITLFGALGFSVATYMKQRPVNATPLLVPLAEQFVDLLTDNFIPPQNIRLLREDAVVSSQERYTVRRYEVRLPDTINWPGLRKLLVESLARKQVTVVEKTSENKGQHEIVLSLGRCPFAEAVFLTRENNAVAEPDCSEVLDVARQAMLAVGVVSGAISLETRDISDRSYPTLIVHMPPGIAPLRLENALADAVAPFDGYLEFVEEKELVRVSRLCRKSGPCAELHILSPKPDNDNAQGTPSDTPTTENEAPADKELNQQPSSTSETTSTEPENPESPVQSLSQVRQTTGTFISLVPSVALLGSLTELPEPVIAMESASTETGSGTAYGVDPENALLYPDTDPVVTEEGSIPAETASETASVLESRPRVAIILDDGGWGGRETEQILALDPRLTLSILPNTPFGTETAMRAAELGFEIMLHMPMQNGHGRFPGELRVDMTAEQIRELTLQAAEQIPGACGANNHTGTTFTRNKEGMEHFMDVMVELGWFFVDSRTTPGSVGYATALEKGVPALNRDIFLDHENTSSYINRQFGILLVTARKNGFAVGIGHFRPNTVAALEKWIPKLDEEGIDLVHASELLP